MTSPTVAPVGSAQQASPTRVSFEEFLAWADEDTLAEWVDGEIVPMSPSSLDHQRVLLFLYDLLNRYIRAGHLGEALVAPVLMRLASRPSGREPELLFVAAAN